jgi:hypothetical protein
MAKKQRQPGLTPEDIARLVHEHEERQESERGPQHSLPSHPRPEPEDREAEEFHAGFEEAEDVSHEFEIPDESHGVDRRFASARLKGW